MTVGMLLSGHHTTDGYGRYDCTKELKQEEATLVVYNPGLNYDMALAQESKRFVEEDLVGSDIKLKPLIVHLSRGSTSNPIIRSEASSSGSAELQVQVGRILQNSQTQIPKQIETTIASIRMLLSSGIQSWLWRWEDLPERVPLLLEQGTLSQIVKVVQYKSTCRQHSIRQISTGQR